MYFEIRKNGKISLVSYDSITQRPIRMRQSECPETIEEAIAFCKKYNEEHPRAGDIQREKNRWRDLYPQYVDILFLFENLRREEAEYSWRSYSSYLSNYIFPYFLETMGLSELKDWPKKFELFREHIQSINRIRREEGRDVKLSYSTMNGIIKALNSFMLIMTRREMIDAPRKCRMFDKSKLRVKGVECILTPDQSSTMFRLMNAQSEIAAKMFWVSLHTGMRVGELFGLSLQDLTPGNCENETMKRLLKSFPYKSYGFITLDSQPLLQRLRDEKKEVPRKPLKGKAKISGKESLTIPIFNEKCFNILVECWNEQRDLYLRRKYGPDPKNYLLFNGLDYRHYYKFFKKAKLEMGGDLKFTPHDSRHTYSTWVVSEAGKDVNLCQAVLGHKSVETTNHYVHIAEQNHAHLRSKVQLGMPMAYSEEKSNTIPLFPEKWKTTG